MVIFTRKSYDHIAYSVPVDSHTITISQEAKFLGLTFDSRLSWKPHINNLISRCKKNVNIIKSLCSTWWGADPRCLLTVYRALIRSVIEYGSSVLPIKNFSVFEKIEIIQRARAKSNSQCLELLLAFATPLLII